MPDAEDGAATYRHRVMIDVLNAVVRAGGAVDEKQHMLELQMAVAGMCDAIAMLVAASGEDRTPKDRRDTADLCRRYVLTAANGIAQKLAAGGELSWTLGPVGDLN